MQEVVKFADLFIGAVQVKGEKSPHIITEEMVKTMKKGAVIVDVAIDQGGCVETSYPTTLSDPTFIKHDVIHYCVPNIPALVSRTASYGLTNASLEYIMSIADNGLANALLGDIGFQKVFVHIMDFVQMKLLQIHLNWNIEDSIYFLQIKIRI